MLAALTLTTAVARTSSLARMTALRSRSLCMTSKPFGVMVAVTIKPERRDEFLQVMHADAQGSRGEPDCLRFDLLVDNEDPNKFYFYEVYKSKEALAFHKEQPHYKKWADFKAKGGTVLSQVRCGGSRAHKLGV